MDLVGGWGHDWISGGSGQDGILGDDGRIRTSRNASSGVTSAGGTCSGPGTTENPCYSEPLHGVRALLPSDPDTRAPNGNVLNEFISTPGSIQTAVVNVANQLNKAADLTPFSLAPASVTDQTAKALFVPWYADDIVYGGLGSDFLHGGAGDDAMSGAEALAVSYAPIYGAGTAALGSGLVRTDWTRPYNPSFYAPIDATTGAGRPSGFSSATVPAGVLGYGVVRPGDLAMYDEYNGMRLIALDETGRATDATTCGTGVAVCRQWLLNVDHTEGPETELGCVAVANNGTCTAPLERRKTDGDDVVFGDYGNDWLVGGTGRDTLWGGWGNDLLNADDDLFSVNPDPDPALVNQNKSPDTHPSYEDRAVGGAGLDVLIGNTGGDRQIDWVGEFNSFLVPFAPFGIATVSRQVPPGLYEFLYALSKAQGADQTLNPGANSARNGEPYGELGLVTQKDSGLWQEQTGGPRDPQPGNVPGGRRDVLRGADFNDGTMSGFYVDSGTWRVSGSALQVAAASLGKDAASVFYVDDYLPVYYEIAASVSVVKPTGGWKANAYVIFDYFSPTDFKFAGIDVSINKIVMGYRDASGWVVVAQTPKMLKFDTWYQLLLAVNGTTATLVVDGETAFTHTFDARVIDGERYALNKGMVGMGSDNARGQFDNIRAQILPPQITLDSNTDLTSSTGPLTTPVSGTCTRTTSGYTGTPATAAASAIVPAQLGDVRFLASTSWLRLTTTFRTSGVAGIAFDVYDDDDLKFAVIDVPGQRVVIGHHDPRRGWVVDAVHGQALTADVLYTLDVQLKGAAVTVALNGLFMLSHGFNAGLSDGRFGLLSRGTPATFTALRVRTDDPQFGEAAPPPPADPTVPPSAVIDDVTVTEGTGGTRTVTVTVTLDRAPAAGETVRIPWNTVDGTALFGDDYGLASGILSFSSGVSMQQITLTIVTDSTVEADEHFFVALTSGTGYTLAKDTGRVTVVDDDVPTVSVTPTTTTEGGSGTKTVLVTVRLSTAAFKPVTVAWATGGGTATAGTDYVAASGTVSFAPGETSRTIAVTVNGDLVWEPDETFVVTLSAPTGATLGTSSATVTITNDDVQPTVTLTSSATSVHEPSAATVTYTLTRGANLNGTASVVVTFGGTATRGADYVVDGVTVGTGGSVTVTFADGVGTRTFSVRVQDDTTSEPTETVVVSIGSCSGCAVSGSSSTTLSITDDDVSPVLTLGPGSSSTTEGGGATLTYTVTRTGSTTGTVSVAVGLGGTATRGSDYTVAVNGTAVTGSSLTLTLAAGVTSATFTVTVLDDTTHESSETLSLALGTCTGCTVGTPGSTTLTITDDDAPPSLTISGASVVEGDKGSVTATVWVRLSAASGAPVTVVVSLLSGGTATAGTDYQSWTPVTVTFDPGQTARSVSVTVLGDRSKEPDETVLVGLSSATGATIATGQATVWILDDDSRLMTATAGPGAERLSDAHVQQLLAAAVARWAAGGADTAVLTGLRVVVADLPGATDLAQVVGSTVLLDADAAGWGWSAALEGVAAGRIDLLSVLLHEIGHVLGLEHGDRGMGAVLLPGVRDVAVLDHDGPGAAGRPVAADSAVTTAGAAPAAVASVQAAATLPEAVHDGVAAVASGRPDQVERQAPSAHPLAVLLVLALVAAWRLRRLAADLRFAPAVA
ncbi:MAG TPA: Calx-beta domain-containing protein [Mycobacteriales bacterium]|nr:Calx-beta domain-containing protein [Mycobacteriales bacterium]